MKFLVAIAATSVHGLRMEEGLTVNPIRRVVTILQKMQKEVQAEGENEKKLYEKFMCYCKGNTDGLKAEMEQNAAEAAKLKSNVDSKAARKQQLDQDLVQHKQDRQEAKEAIAKATTIRQKEHETFIAESRDQKSYVDALGKAIPAIEHGMGRSLLQTQERSDLLKQAAMKCSESVVSQMDKETVLAFLSQKGPYGDYNAASGEIVGILKTMKDNIEKDLGGIIEIEEKAQQGFDELVVAKEHEIKAASEAIEKKSVRSGELAVEVTQDANSAENAAKEREANAEFLANLQKDCGTKSSEWDVRTKTRNDEILAISEAIEILSGDDALSVFKKTLPSPATPGAAPGTAMFLQRTDDSEESRRVYAFAFIQSAGLISTNRSPQLNLLAHMLKVGKVNFAKVIQMIVEMAQHLEQEQKTDDEQKEWCHVELENADDTKKELERKISDVTSLLDQRKNALEATKEEIESLTNKIAELDKSVTEATKQRQEQHAEFVQSTSELTAAKQLIEKATNRLHKFYSPALYKEPPARELTDDERIAQNLGEELPTVAPQMIAGTTVPVMFFQINDKPEAAPETWSGGYKKKSGKSGGIVALMNNLQKDLDMQLLEGKKDEETSQRDYEELMADAKKIRATDSKSLTDDEVKKGEIESCVSEQRNERQMTVEEHQNLQKEISNLHGQCDFLTSNYDFRKEARSKEREALNNAKAVLSGADYQ